MPNRIILSELESLWQNQLTRIQSTLNGQPASMVDQTITNLAAGATPVLHAVGKRKPSLSELDQLPLRRRLR